MTRRLSPEALEARRERAREIRDARRRATWAQLPNAALIDTLYARVRGYMPAGRNAVPVTPEQRTTAFGATYRAARSDRLEAFDAVRETGEGKGPARGIGEALVVWDDMPTFIAMDNEALNAYRRMGAGADVEHKALYAQLYKEIVK